jgi:hypothetical protein
MNNFFFDAVAGNIFPALFRCNIKMIGLQNPDILPIKHVRVRVNIVNIALIIHAGEAGLSQDRETEIFYKARLGRLALYLLSVPVEVKGFKKDQCTGLTTIPKTIQ